MRLPWQGRGEEREVRTHVSCGSCGAASSRAHRAGDCVFGGAACPECSADAEISMICSEPVTRASSR